MEQECAQAYGDSHFKLGVYFNDKSHKHLIRVLHQDIPLDTGEKECLWNLSELAVSEQRHEIDTSRIQVYSGGNEHVLPLKMTGSESHQEYTEDRY